MTRLVLSILCVACLSSFAGAEEFADQRAEVLSLEKIVAYLGQLSPDAKLIFATTTPVPEGADGRFAGDAEKYNAAATKVLQKHPEITINDLFTFTKPNHAKWWIKPNDVHYNPAGRAAQGDEVARVIVDELQAVSASADEPAIETVTFTHSKLEGIGVETGVMRRDPSDVIKVDGLYYVWYSKGKISPGYDATVWYATSEDGHKWTEKGMALAKGAAGTWEGASVFTPNILVAEGRYWLFYTGTSKKFGKKFSPDSKIGIAVSDSPAGPWKRLDSNPALVNSDSRDEFDSHLVDDACLIAREGKYWFYYKGRQLGKSPGQTQMGLAIADHPQGPYVKHQSNPVIPGNHEVLVWPQGKGVAAMIGSTGPKEITNSILYSEDGIEFSKTHTVTKGPWAGGAYRPEAFTQSDKGEMPKWGVEISRTRGKKKGRLPFIGRFDLRNDAKASGKTADISHRFLACGKQTYIMEPNGEKSWTYPASTRDGYVLDDGRIVLALSKSKKHRGGAAIVVDPKSGEEEILWKGTQAEVNSVQPTDTGTYVLTEAGSNPRLIEIDRTGKVLVEFGLKCQKKNQHMQTRMARKLSDGTYLAPHLLDFAVFHYDAKGNVLSKFDTTVKDDPEHKIHSWPFTAIRHGDGHTLACLTHSKRVVDFDAEGKVVWQLTNDDLPGDWLQDPCGGQVLPNGNVVITSYAAGRHDPKAPKLIEVNRDKQVVWKYIDGKDVGIHHFQILDTNGERITDPQK